MKYIIIVLSIFALLSVTGGCADISDAIKDVLECTACDDDIDDMYDKYGAPEEINTYDSGSYHSYTYWYWCDGFSYTFTWSGCLCDDISLYTFSPICY